MEAEAAAQAILRRTLGVISAMFALWTLVFGLASTSVPDAKMPSALFFGHAGLLAAAAVCLPGPRPGAWLLTGAAAFASLGFVAYDLHARNSQAALIDGVYPLLSLLIGLRCRPRP
jgi:hypothetical protein